MQCAFSGAAEGRSVWEGGEVGGGGQSGTHKFYNNIIIRGVARIFRKGGLSIKKKCVRSARKN